MRKNTNKTCCSINDSTSGDKKVAGDDIHIHKYRTTSGKCVLPIRCLPLSLLISKTDEREELLNEIANNLILMIETIK